jgi:hypothetical protein
MPTNYDPNFVRDWIVKCGDNYCGPFNSEGAANEWITATHSTGCSVYPLFPGMVS